jgi:hypothetical protein
MGAALEGVALVDVLVNMSLKDVALLSVTLMDVALLGLDS